MKLSQINTGLVVLALTFSTLSFTASADEPSPQPSKPLIQIGEDLYYTKHVWDYQRLVSELFQIPKLDPSDIDPGYIDPSPIDDIRRKLLPKFDMHIDPHWQPEMVTSCDEQFDWPDSPHNDLAKECACTVLAATSSLGALRAVAEAQYYGNYAAAEGYCRWEG